MYGVQRLRRDIHHMGIKTSRWFTVLVTHLDETNFRIVAAYWEVTWRFACPFLLFSVMVASLVNLQKYAHKRLHMIDYLPGGLHSRKRGWIPVSPLGKCHRLVHCALICTGGLACVRSWGFSWKILSFQTAHLFTCIQVVRAIRRGAPASFLFLPDCNWRNDSTNMAIRSASHLFYSRINIVQCALCMHYIKDI